MKKSRYKAKEAHQKEALKAESVNRGMAKILGLINSVLPEPETKEEEENV